MSTEAQLIADKADRMTCDELRAELARILRGMGCVQSAGALRRYKTRYRIMAAELTRKNLEGASR